MTDTRRVVSIAVESETGTITCVFDSVDVL